MEVLSEDNGDEVISLQNSLSPIRGLIEDGPSSSRPAANLELSSELESIPMEDLRSRHTNLVFLGT